MQDLKAWYEGGGAGQRAQALTQAGKGSGRADRRVTLAMLKDEVAPFTELVCGLLMPVLLVLRFHVWLLVAATSSLPCSRTNCGSSLVWL